MTIEEILDVMDEMLDKATTVPFANKKLLVDGEKMRELIDSMRYNMPSEIKRAKELADDKSKIIADANRKADEIVKRAEERAKILVANDTIVKQARDFANDITAQAYKKDKEIKQALNAKMDKMLDEVDRSLRKNINEIATAKNALKALSGVAPKPEAAAHKK
ncbi:MAG: vacuolar-type H+-ATPase subunit H [Oscillospiraceae bacterium]